MSKPAGQTAGASRGAGSPLDCVSLRKAGDSSAVNVRAPRQERPSTALGAGGVSAPSRSFGIGAPRNPYLPKTHLLRPAREGTIAGRRNL